MEKTFAIIKPDAIENKNAGAIIELIERNGFDILGMKKISMTKDEAKQFYAVHKERPFFGELIEYITSGPVIIMTLAKENAIKEWRDLMGATNPTEAAAGTIRRMFGKDIGTNATHGSDAPETAKLEIGQFFPELI